MLLESVAFNVLSSCARYRISHLDSKISFALFRASAYRAGGKGMRPVACLFIDRSKHQALVGKAVVGWIAIAE